MTQESPLPLFYYNLQREKSLPKVVSSAPPWNMECSCLAYMPQSQHWFAYSLGDPSLRDSLVFDTAQLALSWVPFTSTA